MEQNGRKISNRLEIFPTHIQKKGIKDKCGNYRGITLLPDIQNTVKYSMQQSG